MMIGTTESFLSLLCKIGTTEPFLLLLCKICEATYRVDNREDKLDRVSEVRDLLSIHPS